MTNTSVRQVPVYKACGLARKLGQILEVLKEDSQLYSLKLQSKLDGRSTWCTSMTVHAMKESSFHGIFPLMTF